MNHSPTWNSVFSKRVETFNQLNKSFAERDLNIPNVFPDLHHASDLIVASDYSGEHQSAEFMAVSFLIFDPKSSGHVLGKSVDFRNENFPDHREMAYKELSDKCRRRLLIPFLETANDFNGLLFTLLVSKEVKNILDSEGVPHLRNIIPELKNWPDAVIEKLYLVQSFLAFLLAGLTNAHAGIHWVTDNDEIVANEERLVTAHKIFREVSRSHFDRDLDLRFFDTLESVGPNYELLAKDFTALPDLVGGALVDERGFTKLQISTKPSDQTKNGRVLPAKANTIIGWFAEKGHNLRRAAALIKESHSHPNELRFEWLNFSKSST